VSEHTPTRHGPRLLALVASLSLAAAAALVSISPVWAFSWLDPVQVSGSGRSFADPGAIARAGTTTGIAYIEMTSAVSRLYFKRSTNGGASWSSRESISGPTGQPLSVSMAGRGTRFDIVWTQLVGGTARVLYARSNDRGDTWTSVRLSPTSENAHDARVARDGRGRVAIVWAGGPLGGSQHIWSRVSTDSGATFGARVAMATPFSVSTAKPSVAIGASIRIHVAYNGNGTIMYQRTGNNGTSWAAARTLATGVETTTSPGLAASGRDVIVGFTRLSGGDAWVKYRWSNNDGTDWEAARQLGTQSANDTRSIVLNARGGWFRAVFSRCLTDPCTDDAIATMFRRSICCPGDNWQLPRRVSPTSQDRAIPIGVTGGQEGAGDKTVVAWYRQDAGGAILQVWTRRQT
jgi:hypothetical protein